MSSDELPMDLTVPGRRRDLGFTPRSREEPPEPTRTPIDLRKPARRHFLSIDDIEQDPDQTGFGVPKRIRRPPAAGATVGTTFAQPIYFSSGLDSGGSAGRYLIPPNAHSGSLCLPADSFGALVSSAPTVPPGNMSGGRSEIGCGDVQVGLPAAHAESTVSGGVCPPTDHFGALGFSPLGVPPGNMSGSRSEIDCGDVQIGLPAAHAESTVSGGVCPPTDPFGALVSSASADPPANLSGSRNPYTEADIQRALHEITIGLKTLYRASKDYHIPRGTLQYRISERFKHKGSTGPQTVLTPLEESKLVKFLFDMQLRGFPLTASALQQKVGAFVQVSPRPNSFKDGIPGPSWLNGFLRRHPDIAIRTPEGVNAASARVSEDDLRGWYRAVLQYGVAFPEILEAMKDPKRMVNGDEIGFYMYKLAKKVLAKKGSRDVMMVETGDPKKNITVLCCFSADGYCFPPDIILPYKRLPTDVIQSIPGSWGVGRSDSGWMDTINFDLYIKRILYPSLVKRGVKFPVLFFVDGHRSHTAFLAAETCQKLGIVLIAIYPNSTRIIQPADVGIFGPLKQEWRKILEQRPSDSPITTRDFAENLQQAMNVSFKEETIRNAFIATGIYPFDENAPNYSKCLAKSAKETRANAQLIDEPAGQRVTASPATIPIANGGTAVETFSSSNVSLTQPASRGSTSYGHRVTVSPAAMPTNGVTAVETFSSSSNNVSLAEGSSSTDHHVTVSPAAVPFANGGTAVETFSSSNVSLTQPASQGSASTGHRVAAIPIANEASAFDVWVDDSQIEFEFLSPEDQLCSAHSGVCDDVSLYSAEITFEEPPVSLTTSEAYSGNESLASNLRNDDLCNDLCEIIACDPVSPLQDITNQRRVSISDFLQTPPTPKRNTKHINYKIKANPILTADERLEELRKLEEAKQMKKQQKIENAKKREEVKLIKLAEKEKREEQRKRKREEKEEWNKLQETLKKRKLEEKREKAEAKKRAAKAPNDIYVRLR